MLTRRTKFVRLINDGTFPDHTFCLARSRIEVGGLGKMDSGRHDDSRRGWIALLPGWTEGSTGYLTGGVGVFRDILQQ